jgi:hypothetical protein
MYRRYSRQQGAVTRVGGSHTWHHQRKEKPTMFQARCCLRGRTNMFSTTGECRGSDRLRQSHQQEEKTRHKAPRHLRVLCAAVPSRGQQSATPFTSPPSGTHGANIAVQTHTGTRQALLAPLGLSIQAPPGKDDISDQYTIGKQKEGGLLHLQQSLLTVCHKFTAGRDCSRDSLTQFLCHTTPTRACKREHVGAPPSGCMLSTFLPTHGSNTRRTWT